MYSLARIRVRRSARAAGASSRAARTTLRAIVTLILNRAPQVMGEGPPFSRSALPVGVGVPLLARCAEAVQLELVVGDGEAVVLGHPVLQFLDTLVLELGDGAAGSADQVIM